MSDHLPCRCDPCPNVAECDGGKVERWDYERRPAMPVYEPCPICKGRGRVQPPVSDKMVERDAKFRHETYERLAPTYNYATRTASACPWGDVPPNNRALMLAVSRAALETTHRGGTP